MKPTDDQIAFIAMLASGSTFESAALSMGDAGMKAAFDCILNGWVDRGRLTDAGRKLAHQALKPTPWEITVLPSTPRRAE